MASLPSPIPALPSLILLASRSPTPPCCAVDTNYYGNDADNKYNALQVKRPKSATSYGLQFIAHYTFFFSRLRV